MEHITNVLVYSNRCEVLDSHVFTIGDKGFPHIRLKFIYMFGAETLQGKQLELKYILPDKSYQVENINVTEKDEVLFPIHYSVFVNGGWTTLKITIVEGANRITLDDIIIKTKKLEAEQEFQHKDVKAIVQTEITKISKKIKEFEEETKTELNTLKSNLSQNLETEKNSNIEALKEAYNNEIKKLDGDVKKVVTKYLKENTDTFNGEIVKLTDALNGKENSFDKNTAFNKNFGTTADTVLEGNKLDEINEKFKTVNNGIDAKFKGVAGGKVNLNFIQDPGEKIEGEYYLDKTSGKLHRCIKRTSSTVNSAEYFKDMSMDSIVNRLENLIKYESIDKTVGTRYTALIFEKKGNIGYVFLDVPSGVSKTLTEGSLLFTFPKEFKPKAFNLKVLVSYPNGQTARTRYDSNTGNLYILSPIQVVESMYLDTFYFLD